MKNCVIYTRFSPRPDAAECDSCDKQEERCLNYAANKNYHWQLSCCDENVSGGRLFRPGLQEAIGALKSGWILIVDRSDRLARDIAVGLAIRTQIKDLGCTIEYVDGTPSGDNPEDTLFQNIMSSFATYERDRTRFATKRAMRKKKEACERVGQIPIGWKLNPDDLNKKKLIIDEQERLCIEMMCRWRAEGIIIGAIQRDLNVHYGLCRGHSWSAKTIRRLIKKHRFWACPKTGDFSLEPDHPI